MMGLIVKGCAFSGRFSDAVFLAELNGNVPSSMTMSFHLQSILKAICAVSSCPTASESLL
jgi:hypothetical protein